MSSSVIARHTSVLTLVAMSLTATAAGIVTAAPAEAAAATTYRMTVMPTTLTTSDGAVWEARSGFDGGDFSQSFTSGTIAGAADSRLYYPELVRFNSWSKPVENGTWRVTLKMREMWWNNPGDRVFDVAAEGATKLTDVDIVKAVGKNRAYDRTFDVTVTDGKLDLAFPAKADSALLSALEMTKVESSAPAPSAGESSEVVTRMTAGDSAVQDAAGNTYEAATGFSAPVWTASYPQGALVAGTQDQALYRAERTGMKTWSRAVPNGTYDVTLKMREAYWKSAGQRVFDVKAEGATVLSDIDIVKSVGKNTAYDRTFRTQVADGRLDVAFVNKVDRGLVSAVVVTRVSPSGMPAPTTPAPAPSAPAPTTPAPSAPTSNSAYGKVSGMKWDSGLYPMNRASEVTRWEAARGRKVDVITVFPSRESWNSLQSTWFMDDQRIPAGYAGTLDVGMPLWPDNGNLATAKSGGYNAEWERFARSVAAKYPNAYIRLGWEMNLPGWKAAAYPATAEDWKTAYRHAVTSIRKGGPNLRIAWVVNEGPGQTGTQDARMFYPGDAYVDYIGMDAYDWWPGYTSEANIARHRDGAYGWNFWMDFARQHGKRFVLPEWGIAPANSAGGGDNPMYINFVYSWLNQNADNIAYESYFDESDSYIRSDLFTGTSPKATAEYKRWMPLLGRS